MSEEAIKQAFSLLDRNQNGCIEHEEFTSVLQVLDGTFTSRMCDAMFTAADADKNSQLDIDEFIKWIFNARQLRLCSRLNNLSMLKVGTAEGMWRSNRGGSGYFALRWDLGSETPTLQYSNAPPVHTEPKTFETWSSKQVELGVEQLLQFDFTFLDIEGRVFVEKTGTFQGWFKSTRDHGVYQGEPVRDWNPRALTAKAPLKGLAQGEWRHEGGTSGFFALKWNLDADPPEVECCSNNRGHPSRSFKLKSAKVTTFGIIHIDFSVGDLEEAFVDILWDGSFHGWFQGPRDHGSYFGTRVEEWDVSAPRPQKLVGSAMQYPEYWESRDRIFRSVVPISSEDPVFSGMQTLLARTFKRFPDGRAWSTKDRGAGVHPVSLKLAHLHRIEDSSLWWQYHRRRWQINSNRGYGIDCIPLLFMEGSGSPKTTAEKSTFLSDLDELSNEHYLFHGTSPEAARSISEQGFRIDFAGKFAGTAFGPGAYLAESSSKSDEYARADDNGLYAILVCRVCCGKFARTEDFVYHSDESRALMEEVQKGEHYDFLLGDREAKVGTYREFIAFSGSAIYPEYIISYERVAYGLVDGQWFNNSGNHGQFSIKWDPSKSHDNYAIEIVNCGRTVNLDSLTASCEPSGSLVFRGAYGSGRDFGSYRGYKNVRESILQTEDDLEGLAPPESGHIEGHWESSSGEAGNFIVQWDASNTFRFTNSGHDVELKECSSYFQLGCHIIDFSFLDVEAHLEVFMFGTGCMAFVGSWRNIGRSGYGIYLGTRECSHV